MQRGQFRILPAYNFCLYVERSKHFILLHGIQKLWAHCCSTCVASALVTGMLHFAMTSSLVLYLCSLGDGLWPQYINIISRAHLLYMEWFICLKLKICLDDMKSYECVQVLGRDVCIRAAWGDAFWQPGSCCCVPDSPVRKYVMEILSVMNIFYH